MNQTHNITINNVNVELRVKLAWWVKWVYMPLLTAATHLGYKPNLDDVRQVHLDNMRYKSAGGKWKYVVDQVGGENPSDQSA